MSNTVYSPLRLLGCSSPVWARKGKPEERIYLENFELSTVSSQYSGAGQGLDFHPADISWKLSLLRGEIIKLDLSYICSCDSLEV